MKNYFTVVDFETANPNFNSICQIGLVRIENQIITEQLSMLVQPPDNYYKQNFIDLHGITPEQTANALTFDFIWPQIKPFIENQFVVAHGGFDYDFQCLKQTLEYYALSSPDFTRHCTYRVFGQSISSLCKQYGIAFNNYDCLSYAQACAQLYQIHLKKN